MTNTTDRIEALASDLGFRPDSGFSGYPALYNERGDGAMVLVVEDEELRIQLYKLDGGDDFELLRDEGISLRAEWGEYSWARSQRRIRDLAEGVLPNTHLL